MKDPLSFRADLHCHTTCSDGSFTPEELVQLAAKFKLKGLSITDHDTIQAYSAAIPLCKELGIELIPGAEFSSVLNDASIHILGYGIDIDSPKIIEFCNLHRQRRTNRNRAILEKLESLNMPISPDEIARKDTVGRPHIAQAMIKKGYVKSIQEAFKKFIGDGKPCYDPGKPFSVQETIDIIHEAHGVAVIAHPHLIPRKKTIKALLELNFDGIECYYGNFQANEHQKWVHMAHQKGWLITGGSDFHGDLKPGINLGCSWVNEEVFNKLKDSLDRLK